jgi:hypothetical protein
MTAAGTVSDAVKLHHHVKEQLLELGRSFINWYSLKIAHDDLFLESCSSCS